MRKRLAIALSAAAVLLFAPAGAQAVTITIDNASVGLNDPTAVAPVGGNPGMTLGDQRRFALQYAANLWGRSWTAPTPGSAGCYELFVTLADGGTHRANFSLK